MKKILSIVIAVVFVLSMTAVAVSAQAYNPNGICEVKFDVKHADPANVVKDGVIGDGEYEKLNVDVDPNSSSLTLVFGNNAAMYTNAEEMMSTMEYYFSWDEVHGLNFAVKCKPPVYEQHIPMGAGDPPLDNWLANLGLQLDISQAETYPRGERPFFYYSICKNAQTGEYMTGHWGQFGLLGNYNAVGGTDFEVAFNADGSILYEWSIPFSAFTASAPADGTKIFFSLATMAGTDAEEEQFMDCYGVLLGDYGFMHAQAGDHSQAIATLSSEQIAGGSSSGNDSTNPGTNPSSDNPGTEPKTDDPSQGNDNPSQGNDNPSQGNDNPSQGNKAPSTADPIVIATIASVLSACGFMISKKRK